MGLLQRFQIALDAASKAKFESEMQSAGKEGADKLKQGMGNTNPMQPINDEARKTSGIFSGLSGVFKGVGAALGAAFAISKIKEFAANSIAAANESDKVWNEFSITLQNNGSNIDAVRDRFEALGQKFLQTTKFGDEAAISSANTYVQITGDIAGAENAVAVAADLAAARHMDLEKATVLVARAANGNVTQLQRMGIEIPKGTNAVDALAKRFKGAAEGEMNTFAGKTQQLGNYFGELQEEIGHAMIAAGEGSSIMDTFSGILQGAAKWVHDNADSLQFLGTILLGAVSTGFKAVGFLVTSFATGLQKMWAIGKVAFEGILTGFQKLMEFGAKVADALGMDIMAQEMRNAANTAKGILTDLEAKNKKATDEIKEAHTSMGANLGSSLEGGSSRGTVAMQKLQAEAQKTREKFEAEVKAAADAMPELAEQALREFSNITKATLDEITYAANEAQRKQLEALKANLIAEEEAFTEAQTQIVITQGMTTEQRRAEFERAAAAQDAIEAQSVVDGLQRNDEYMKTQEYRDQQRVEAMSANADELAANQVAAEDGAAASIQATEGRVTANHTQQTNARLANMGRFIGGINDTISGVVQMGNVFGITSGQIGGALGGITQGLGSVIGAIQSTVNAGQQMGNALGSIFGALGQQIGNLMGQITAMAGLGGTVAGITGGNKTGGAIGGAIGGVVGGPIGGIIGGVVGGAIGGIFKGDKDPGRLRTNQEMYNRALQGDQAALDFLRVHSNVSKNGSAGWATERAAADARQKYQQALAALGQGGATAAAPSFSSLTAAYSAPKVAIPTGSYSLSNPTPTGASKYGGLTTGGITVNQYGVTGDNVTEKTVRSISDGLGTLYQKAQLRSGNTRM